MNEIIRAELAKIEKGSRNEGNLLKYIYLTMRAEEIIENLPRIGSSRAKDEETYVAIALVLNGKVTRAYASEVNEGPYEATVKNIEKFV